MFFQSNLGNVLNSYYDFDQIQKCQLMINGNPESVKGADTANVFPKLRHMLFQYKYMYKSLKVLLTFSLLLMKSTNACCATCLNL